jgi:hypothetical protein
MNLARIDQAYKNELHRDANCDAGTERASAH